MPTLREALSAAIDKSAAGSDEAEVETESEAPPEVEAAAGDVEPVAEVAEPAAEADEGRDERGRFRKDEQGRKEKPEAAAEQAAAAPEKEAAAEKPPEAAAPALRPPASWKADAREKWAAVPPEAQREIVRLDREVRQVMQESAGARRLADTFEKTIAPYEAMIRAEQGDQYNPITTVQSLLRTAAAFRVAPAGQVADLMASLVTQFGVERFGPHFIAQLDKALGGGGPAAEAGKETPPPGPAEYRDPRVDKLLGHIEQSQRARVQAEQRQGQAMIDAFRAGHEFFGDVEQDMADLIDGAARRGKEMTLDEAYKRACAADERIAGVMRQRAEAKAIAERKKKAQGARAAGSSIRPNPGAGGSAPAPEGNSRRAALEEAFAEAETR